VASKGGGGFLLIVIVVAVAGYGYYRSEQGLSEPPPAPPQAPPADATGRYVALGDSYTSAPGTGARAGDPPGCDRSVNNYPHLVAAELGPAEFVDVSCSGATTADLTEPQLTSAGTNPPQLDAVTTATTLVTVGIGGNDVGLVGLARDCATTDPDSGQCRDRFTGDGSDELARRAEVAGDRLGEVLRLIHDKAPRARVAVVGYPTVLPDGDGCWPVVPVGAADIGYLRESIERLNEELRQAAEAGDAGFVDTATPTKGHDMCTSSGTRFVEPLVPSSPAAPLHPNARGSRAMADAVLRVVD
jgi:lysophospholipase L1-like esterase